MKFTLSLQALSLAVAFALVQLFLAEPVCAEPTWTVPLPPGTLKELRANAVGDLYSFVSTNVWQLSLHEPNACWRIVPLTGVVDLSENAGLEVFVRQDTGTVHTIYRLSGTNTIIIAHVPADACESWYVDAVGRIWCQNKEQLRVVSKDGVLLETTNRKAGNKRHFGQPCEWRPGYLMLFYGLDAAQASPTAVTAGPLPPFACDASGRGVFKLGPDHLLYGNINSIGGGSLKLNMRQPEQSPERVRLGWDWFYGIATAPDGRLLTLAQTDHNPQFTLFWYGVDGLSQIRLKGAEDVIRANRNPYAFTTSRIVFTANSLGFTVTGNGLVGVFQQNNAVLLTPSTGLPLFPVQHLAAVSNDLVIAGNGKIVIWRTTKPLATMTDVQFDARLDWPLAGPCARDCHGNMWAFLLDFPGMLSCHDGVRWRHLEVPLGNKIPQNMTGDDQGRLQIDFQDYPAGSTLLTDGKAESWNEAPVRAWWESVRAGATWFSDGSPFRPRHVVGGRDDWVWAYNGRRLYAEGEEYDYYELPAYSHFWIGANGVFYRAVSGRVWAYVDGCWIRSPSPPLSIGREGLAAVTAPGRLPVIYDGQLKLQEFTPEPKTSKNVARSITLQGNVAFILTDGGGWLGGHRLFNNAFYALDGRVYPGTNGHYFVDNNMLHFQPPQVLEVEGEVVCDGKTNHLACRITGKHPLFKPRLLVFINGAFHASLMDPTGVNLPDAPPGRHELDVYAADGFGVVSKEPLQLAFDGGLETPVQSPKRDDTQAILIESFKLDDTWMAHPQQWHALPTMADDRKILGQRLEIDAAGVVWVLTNRGVVGIDQTHRQLSCPRLHVREIVAVRGRVFALGGYNSESMRFKLYELRPDNVVQVAEFYDDSLHASQQIWSDGDGGLWLLSTRAVVRWDGENTRIWERPIGYNAEVLPIPAGAIIRCHNHYLLYRNNELSQPQPWPGKITLPVYVLGPNFLVVNTPRKSAGYSLIELAGNRLLEQQLPRNYTTLGSAAGGDLYAWHDQQLSLVSGVDLTRTPLTYSTPPTHLGFEPGGYKFLATTNNVIVYPINTDQIVAGSAKEGAVEYGVETGVLAGDTFTIREAPDGRIWILRSEQLLVFDPKQRSSP